MTPEPERLSFAGRAYFVQRPAPFGLVFLGPAPAEASSSGVLDPPCDYLHAHLLCDGVAESFFALVDAEGLVVCKRVQTDATSYRDVRGRSSRGRLSPGEYYHHDGCSGPTKPRIQEIRCPYQTCDRGTLTAIAPFPDTVYAMLKVLPRRRCDGCDALPWDEELERVHASFTSDRALDPELWDRAQGLATRWVRRALSSHDARAYFNAVDLACGAYRPPWEQGESRFMANDNPSGATMQHRRAYARAPRRGEVNGRLVKRWPAEELFDTIMSSPPGPRSSEADSGAPLRPDRSH